MTSHRWQERVSKLGGSLIGLVGVVSGLKDVSAGCEESGYCLLERTCLRRWVSQSLCCPVLENTDTTLFCIVLLFLGTFT